MNDFMYEVLQRSAATTAFREHTSHDSDLYANAQKKHRQNLLTKKLTPGHSHSSQFQYMADVIEKYNIYLEQGKKIGISDQKYVSQFSDKVSYGQISTLAYYEIADYIYWRSLLSNLPTHADVYLYGCECQVPIYPIKSLLYIPEVQTELKKRIVRHYLRSKNCPVSLDISSISLELKDDNGGDYLIISFPAQIDYEDSMTQFDL